MVILKKTYASATEADLQKMESRTGVVLPAAYRNFLLEFNGGQPTPDEFQIPGFVGVESAVCSFFGIQPGEYEDLENMMQVYRDRVPTDFIPIADDAGGNLLVIGWRGEHTGRIYYWDHDDEMDDDGCARTDMANMYCVAQDLQHFLDSLTAEV